MTTNGDAIGKYVRQLRRQHGFGLRHLAAAARVDPTWLSRLEHGTYDSPDPRSLYRVPACSTSKQLTCTWPSDTGTAVGCQDSQGICERSTSFPRQQSSNCRPTST
jgi:transcriptional regulator with XRE-family HTH domain